MSRLCRPRRQTLNARPALLNTGRLNVLLCLLLVNGLATAGRSPAEEDWRSRADADLQVDLLEQVKPWYTRYGEERLPSREKPLIEDARRSIVPPRTKRKGLEPRIGLSIEFRDNFFFTPDDQQDELISVLSPGFSYARRGRASVLNVDYALEAADYRNNDFDRLVDAQYALILASWEISPRLGFYLVEDFEDTHDPTQQPLVTTIPGVTRVRTNTLVLGTAYRMQPDLQGSLRYRNELALIDDPSGRDIEVIDDPSGRDSEVHELSGDLTWLVGRVDRSGLIYRARAMDFEATDEVIDEHSLSFSYKHSYSQRLALEMELGYLDISTATDNNDWRGVLVLRSVRRNLLLDIGVRRDVTTAAGVGAPLFEKSFSSSFKYRLGPRWQLGAELHYGNFRTLQEDRIDIDAIDARAFLSYAVRPRSWLRFRYGHRQQELRGEVTRSNNYTVSVVFVL